MNQHLAGLSIHLSFLMAGHCRMHLTVRNVPAQRVAPVMWSNGGRAPGSLAVAGPTSSTSGTLRAQEEEAR